MEDKSRIEMNEFLRKHEDIVYIAGLLDGEGCIGIWRSGKYYQPCVVISNQNIRVLKQVKKILSFGSVVRKRTAYEYHVYRRENIKRLLTAVLPYLNVKRVEARLMLDFLNTVNRRKQGEITFMLSSLKTKNKRIKNNEFSKIPVHNKEFFKRTMVKQPWIVETGFSGKERRRKWGG
ncbi:MAG: LAGLIDADG family homing endonuclease [Thermofilum sp.]